MAKKILTLTLIVMMTLALTFTVSATTMTDTIGSNGHTFMKFDLDAIDSSITSMKISFNITNYDDVAASNDDGTVDVQVVFNSDLGWTNIGNDLNQWGNIFLDSATDSFTWPVDGSEDYSYFEVCVGAWNGLEGTYTVELIGATAPANPPANNNTPANNTGGNNTINEEDKHEPDTGLGDVAVASAIALVAAGAVVFSRKKK